MIKFNILFCALMMGLNTYAAGSFARNATCVASNGQFLFFYALDNSGHDHFKFRNGENFTPCYRTESNNFIVSGSPTLQLEVYITPTPYSKTGVLRIGKCVEKSYTCGCIFESTSSMPFVCDRPLN